MLTESPQRVGAKAAGNISNMGLVAHFLQDKGFAVQREFNKKCGSVPMTNADMVDEILVCHSQTYRLAIVQVLFEEPGM